MAIAKSINNKYKIKFTEIMDEMVNKSSFSLSKQRHI